ncbi:MAG: hypothetical protein JXR51_07530 [Bacteroidales bacterium]|nr:hypothetical protein [Bacteroidales bacterium]
MKNKLLLIILSIIIIQYSCRKDTIDPHVFERGQIISAELIGTRSVENIRATFTLYDINVASQINFEYGVELYAITYETITPDGQETQASGLLAVPQGISVAAPLLSFQHGTVLRKNDVPSTLASGYGMEIGLIYGTEGYIVCMPDFLGLGKGEGLHPYMHSKSEATATIDMIRASKNKLADLAVDLNNQLFLMGYSQGGHATMATHKIIEAEYDDEFNVTASSPMAGPFDVSGIMADLILEKAEYVSPGYFPYMLYSYNSVYNFYDDLESIFKAPYNSSLPTYFNGENLYSLSDVEDILPSIPSDILTDNAYNEIVNKTKTAVWDALEDNDLYDWHSVAPIRMFHCNGDITVPMSNSEKALQYFINNGVTNAELVNPFEGGTHSTCLIPSILAAKEWFNTFKD